MDVEYRENICIKHSLNKLTLFYGISHELKESDQLSVLMA